MPNYKKRKRQNTGRFLNIVILIIVFLVIFEGKLLVNVFKKETFQAQITAQLGELFARTEPETQTEEPPQTETQTEAQTEAPPKSSAIVQAQSTPVDDSYFSDAVFIGDSRVEGFRNQSGITQGTFLTGVGMDTSSIFETPYIATESGMVTAFQAMYNTDYKKVYIMLGTNDLGEPDFNDFKEHYRVCLSELKKLAPDAIFYVMSVAYVEEDKLAGSEYGSYVNNANIKEVNEKILELCEENGYYYVDINEVLSNGNDALIKDASSDGIHMYENYCKLWLNYLKNHYITADQPSSESESQKKSGSETESSSGAKTDDAA